MTIMPTEPSLVEQVRILMDKFTDRDGEVDIRGAEQIVQLVLNATATRCSAPPEPGLLEQVRNILLEPEGTLTDVAEEIVQLVLREQEQQQRHAAEGVREAMRVILTAKKWGAALGAAREDEKELAELFDKAMAEQQSKVDDLVAAIRNCYPQTYSCDRGSFEWFDEYVHINTEYWDDVKKALAAFDVPAKEPK